MGAIIALFIILLARIVIGFSPTSSGYLEVDETAEMFHVFFEASQPSAPQADESTRPIILWLQGGPGCSSLFGLFYINGPYFINKDLKLRKNLGSWNRLYGMLFIEQPMGTGFSIKGGAERIPQNELDVARDLFLALQSFYRNSPSFANRPLIITGESYAGKYVPSIAHYILQQTLIANGNSFNLDHPRPIPENEFQAPLFVLGGIAVGNGFTDADTQTLTQADVAWALGLIDKSQKTIAEQMQVQVVELVRDKLWKKARALSDELNNFISNSSGTSTLEDVRRNVGYDGDDRVDAFVNQPHVKRALGVPNITWTSCSDEVDLILGPDIMKSVKHLVQDLVSNEVPSLFYAGQFDAECGAASNDAWISTMKWSNREEFYTQPRQLWKVAGRVAGFWRGLIKGPLMQLVIRNTGHMMPHDNPLYGQLMIEKFIEEKVTGREYSRDQMVTAKMEKEYANPDEGPNANPDDYELKMPLEKGFEYE